LLSGKDFILKQRSSTNYKRGFKIEIYSGSLNFPLTKYLIEKWEDKCLKPNYIILFMNDIKSIRNINQNFVLNLYS
jgi:hypothetical protein